MFPKPFVINLNLPSPVPDKICRTRQTWHTVAAASAAMYSSCSSQASMRSRARKGESRASTAINLHASRPVSSIILALPHHRAQTSCWQRVSWGTDNQEDNPAQTNHRRVLWMSSMSATIIACASQLQAVSRTVS
jgi:hypothetical protein